MLICIIVSIVLLEVITWQVLLPLFHWSVALPCLLAGLIGFLLGLVGYFSGNFWDSLVFDRLYGINGKWLNTTKNPFYIFPVGSDLKRYRDRASHALRLTTGIYREAKKLAKQEESIWREIEQPLLLSKFARSFIWPCIGTVFILILVDISLLFFHVSPNFMLIAMVGVVIFCFGLTLFIPYFYLRIEHMIRLYEYIAELDREQYTVEKNKHGAKPNNKQKIPHEVSRHIDDLGERKLPFMLHQKIIEFLSSIPNAHDMNTQHALLHNAGLDTKLQEQIIFTTVPAQFFSLLVPTLSSYGRLEDGRNAIEAVLKAAENYVGQDRREYCDTLIQKLHKVSNLEEDSLPEPPVKQE